MRSPVYPLLLGAIVALAWALPATAHPAGHGARALLRAERIDARLDRRAAHAFQHGRYRQAAMLDRRGDRIVARVVRRVHWAQDRRAARFPRG